MIARFSRCERGALAKITLALPSKKMLDLESQLLKLLAMLLCRDSGMCMRLP